MVENEIGKAIDNLSKLGIDPCVQSLVYYSQEGNLKIVKLLVEAGIGVNEFVENGLGALTQSCQNNHLDVASFLIDNGADINKKDNSGFDFTPLMKASLAGHKDLIKFLLSKNADLSLKDKDGYTSISYAYKHSKETADILLEAGAEDISDKMKSKIKRNKNGSSNSLREKFIFIVLSILFFGTLFLKGYAIRNNGIELEHGSLLNLLTSIGWLYSVVIGVLFIGTFYTIFTGNGKMLYYSYIGWFCMLMFVLIGLGTVSTEDYFSGVASLEKMMKFQYGWYIHLLMTLITGFSSSMFEKKVD